MWTTVAVCSVALTLSHDETVTSVLCVTNEFSLKGCTIFPELVGDSVIELPPVEVDSLLVDLPVHPENTESEAIIC